MAITVLTARLALLLYLVALLAMLAGARHRPLARTLWTAGFAAYAVHVAAAFHWVHSWSHDAALAATSAQTAAAVGVASGAGLWVNYLFTVVWGIDVAWWWRRPDSYENRSWRSAAGVHAFMAFMFFNGAVVFAQGPSRWIGLVGLGLLGGFVLGLLVRRNARQHRDSDPLAESENAFTQRMRDVALVGTFMRSDNSSPPTPERYVVESVEKVGPDLWRFNAVLNCCGFQGSLPVTVPMQFTDGIPTIVMDETHIPALGTFSARLLFQADSYAGTWRHGPREGSMSGRIVHNEPES
ncbi:MAG: hypothetical protein GKS06_15060 [Acidobacteria bacterium]|nr:hypothetical protein [Acidobacteriota bacterium]